MRIVTLALTGIVWCAVGCGAAQPNATAPATVSIAAKAPGEAQIGDHTVCPVSGEEFVVSATSPKMEYLGKTYFFCCADCVKKFEAEPAKYVGKPGG
jgi:YHS domain-containing protein